MKAKIDLEKFICSLMKRFYKIHNIDPLTTKCWLDKVLEDQGLEYRDGEIVEIPQDSEDERRKKEILDLISISGNGNQFEEIKDWLEYKPQGKSALEAAKEEKVDNANKVEPKFHEGEWIVDSQGFTHQIERVVENVTTHTFGYDIVGGGYFNEDNKNIHLWTIQDAKDGDVLAVDNKPFIYNGSKNEVTVGAYCGFNAKHMFSFAYNYVINQDIIPATKEQCDLLFEKMKEAGWEWNTEKKELKKIEQNLANSAKPCENDTLLDLLHKMPSCITVDGIDYHFVLKKTIAYMAFYEGEGEGSGKVIFWMAGDPVDLLTAMLNKLKEQGLLE